ncbi:MAG: hypothetical protein II841_04855 [Bacteroidales bacterium]|nr:hypothetical protein [Bacteroidales bacterium]
MNNQNLKSNDERTPSERRELAIKAGKASGAARRKKKSMKEWAKILGALPIKVTLPDASNLDSDLNGATIMAMYKSAMKGNVKSAQFLAKLRGELEEQVNVELSGSKKKGNRPVVIQFVDAGDDGCGPDK